MRILFRVASFVLAAVLAAPLCVAAALPQARQTIAGLGTASFVTSTKSAEAQTAFLRGLLLLHLFEYQQAADAFIAAEKLDPAFSMAYWGEAMTYNHGVWNQLDAAGGKAALAKLAATPEARAGLTPDPRERGYLAAVETLYDGTGTKPERDLRYSKAMQQLASNYPHDDDAQLFYALALLGQSESVRDVPVYLQAAAISKAVFEREPNNPGAAHYWIHGMDDPQHAAGAQVAARALSKIAPDAPHAQHMCSHIFIAMGLWDDVVQSNVDAIRVGAAIDKADGFPPNNCGHYPYWLEYGYFQQGRTPAALAVVEACRQSGIEAAAWTKANPDRHIYKSKNPARVQARLASALAEMSESAVIESSDWSKGGMKLDLDPATSETEVMAPFRFVAGYAAAERGDLGEAHSQLGSLKTFVGKAASEPNAEPENVKTFAIMLDELGGLIHAKEHDYAAAVADLTRASTAYSAMAFAFGPPVTIKPPDELLGEVLLEKGDPKAAISAFRHSLELAPGRTLSVLGLARAQKAAGDVR